METCVFLSSKLIWTGTGVSEKKKMKQQLYSQYLVAGRMRRLDKHIHYDVFLFPLTIQDKIWGDKKASSWCQATV